MSYDPKAKLLAVSAFMAGQSVASAAALVGTHANTLRVYWLADDDLVSRASAIVRQAGGQPREKLPNGRWGRSDKGITRATYNTARLRALREAGHSFGQIAVSLGVTRNTVAGHLHRAKGYARVPGAGR